MSAVDVLLTYLERVDGHGALQLARHALATDTVDTVVAELLAPAQRRVGELWATGRWTVAQEHAATAIIDDLLGLAASAVPAGNDGTVALVCAEGEWHVTPARMAALSWRASGWDVTFLGGSTPPGHLRTSLALRRPDLVAVSCTIPLALPGVARVADALRPLGYPMLGGGRAFGSDEVRALALGLDGWAPTAAAAIELLRTWLDRPPVPGRRFVSDGEDLELELQIPTLVASVERRLEERFPPMRDYDRSQRDRTREDLDSILRFVAVTLTVGDPRILAEFLTWLGPVLTARGVPLTALAASLECLLESMDGLPRSTALLERGLQQVNAASADAR